MLTTIKREFQGPRFIEQLRENGGFILKACEAVGISKQTAYNWRNADKDFRRQWDEAIEHAVEQLEAECRRRAYEGVLEPIYQGGKEVGMIRRYSDTLLIFQLKALNARYRDKLLIDVSAVDAEIERRLAAMAAGSQAALSGEAESGAVN